MVKGSVSDTVNVSGMVKVKVKANSIEEFTPAFFDDASAAWRMNKKRKGHSWVYVCNRPGCTRKPSTDSDTCNSALCQPVVKKMKHGYYLRERSTQTPCLPAYIK